MTEFILHPADIWDPACARHCSKQWAGDMEHNRESCLLGVYMLAWRNQEKAVSTMRRIYGMLQIKLQRKLQSRGKGVREWAPVIVINRDSDWDQVRKDVKEAAKGEPSGPGKHWGKGSNSSRSRPAACGQQPRYGLAFFALTPRITGTRSAGTPRSPWAVSLASDS